MGDITTSIIDKDIAFEIDSTTREIKNNSGKTTVMQFDHKSERFSFTINKEVEGFDISKCNSVQVHYYIVEATTRRKVYGVADIPEDDKGSIFHVSPTDSSKWEFSWVLTNSITQYAGPLNFTIQFLYTEENNGKQELLYRWGTGINNSVTIAASINGGETIIEQYSDVIATWDNKINNFIRDMTAHTDEGINEAVDALYGYIDSIADEHGIAETQFATTAEVLAVFGMDEETYLETKYGADIITADHDNVTIIGEEENGSM